MIDENKTFTKKIKSSLTNLQKSDTQVYFTLLFDEVSQKLLLKKFG
jgi:hypothetical protein